MKLGAPATVIPAHPLIGYTAASPEPATTHDGTGWSVEIHLDYQGRPVEGPHSRWRSGETLGGVVQLRRPPPSAAGVAAVEPCSVICRAFYQSTTLYWVARIQHDSTPQGRMGKLLPSAAVLKTDTALRCEWNRAFLINGGQGVELWQDGELDEVVRQVDRDFSVLVHEVPPPRDGGSVTRSAAEEEDSPPPHESVDRTAEVLTLPFEFRLPTAVRVAEANAVAHPLPDRRHSHKFLRAPPPSLPATGKHTCANHQLVTVTADVGSDSPEGKSGVVEWTVEVLVRFPEELAPEDNPLATSTPNLSTIRSTASDAPSERLPDFNDSTPSTAASLSQFGLLSSTPTLLVHRVLFPFEPADQHAQDLYSSWRPDVSGAWAAAVARYNHIPLDEIADLTPVPPGSIVPSFGRDVRDEALGGSNIGPTRVMKGKLVELEGGRLKWSSYEKRMPVKNVFGRTVGWTRTETSLPLPAMITRHARTLELLLHVSFDIPGAREAAKVKPVFFHSVLITLSRRTITRGGREDRPHFLIEELRREEVALANDAGTGPLRLAPREGRDLRIRFDLQSTGAVLVNNLPREQVPVRDLGLSFRTPNLEHEYVLSATLSPVSGPSFYLFRCPVQILAGDYDEVPVFEEASRYALHIIPQDHDEVPSFEEVGLRAPAAVVASAPVGGGEPPAYFD